MKDTDNTTETGLSISQKNELYLNERYRKHKARAAIERLIRENRAFWENYRKQEKESRQDNKGFTYKEPEQ